MKRLYVFLLLVVIVTVNTHAAVTFSVNAPGRVSVGSKFPVTFVLKNAEVSSAAINAPQINGCKLLFGPSTSRFQSYQNINGRSESSSSTEYTFTYKAEKAGTYQIRPVTVSVSGKKYSSQAISITVAPASSQQPSTPSSRRPVSIDDIETQSSDRPIKGSDVFVRISTSRSSSYEQEAIECTIKLYTKYSIAEFMPITQPAFNGFLVEDLPIQAALNQRENVNGQEYATAVVKKCILFPQKSGTLTIISGTYDLTVVQYDNINLGFYSVSQPQTKKIRVNSNSATVNVRPLPTPQPAGFNGAVGQFSETSSLSASSFRTNEPVTLTYTVAGTGNIRYIKDPEFNIPTEFEQYSPQHDVKAEVSGNSVVGTSQTQLTFVPKEVGTYKVIVPEFVYFDPAKNEYVTAPAKTYELKVSKGLSSPVSEQQDVASKNTDIRFIKLGEKDLSNDVSYMISSFGYWLIYIVMVIALTGLLYFSKIRSERMSDLTGLRKSKANRVARKRLLLANKYMARHDSEKFYEETLRALWGYLSDKMSIPASELSRSTIESELSRRGVSESISAMIIRVLDTCEMARYTPSSSVEEIEKVYNQASDSINSLEKTKLS